jgi:hypothetical protein
MTTIVAITVVLLAACRSLTALLRAQLVIYYSYSTGYRVILM